MSHQNAKHQVLVKKDVLFDLFLSRGSLIIPLDGQTVIIHEISSQVFTREQEDGTVYQVVVRGVSSNINVCSVDGKGTLRVSSDEQYYLDLDLRLEDQYD